MQLMLNRYQQPFNEFVDKKPVQLCFLLVSLDLFLWYCLAYNEDKNTLKTFVRFEILDTC